MLSSWFNQKSPEPAPETEKPRRSLDLRYNSEKNTPSKDPNPPRSSLDNPRPKYKTPHDAIISGLQTTKGDFEVGAAASPTKGDLGKADQLDEGQRSPITPISPSASFSRLDHNLSPSPSLYTTGGTTGNLRYTGVQQGGSVQTTTVDVLVDPFDGTMQGVLLPQDGVIGPQDDTPVGPRFNSASVAAASEKMWSHLSKVSDLQSQIAKMHIEMEGVGIGENRKKTKGKHPLRGPVFGEERRMYHPQVPSLRARAMSNASTIGTVVDEKETDEEGVAVTDEETEKSRAREEEFAKLASQFEGKKESIREMMNKLDDLSKALTEFHALQANDVSNPRRDSFSTMTPPTIVSPSTVASFDRVLGQAPSRLPDNMLWAPPKPLVASGNSAALPQSLSRIQVPEPKAGSKPYLKPPALALNSDELPHLTESPVSTTGSLDLQPETK